MRRILSTVLTVLLLVVLVTGCQSSTSSDSKGSSSSSKDDKINLKVSWWGTPVHHEKYQQVIKLFEKKYPSVHITAQYSGWNGYWTKLDTEAAGNSLPQVVQMDYSKINQWVQNKLLEDLTPFEQSGDLQLQDVNSDLLAGGKVNDTLYSIPLGFNSPVLLLNPSQFKKAGLSEFKPGFTWQEYIDTAKQLKQKLGKDYYVPALDDLSSFEIYLRENGQWMYNEDNTGIGFDSQLIVDFLKMWIPLQKEGITPPGELLSSIQDNNTQDLIVTGQAPIENAMWSSQIGAFAKLAGTPLDLSMYPSISGGQKGQFIKPSLSFAITKNTSDEQAKWAAKFIDFFVRSQEANDVLLGIRGPSLYTSVNDQISPKLDENQKKAFDFMANVADYSSPIYPAPPAEDTQVGDLWKKLKEQFDFQKITPEQFAQEFDSGVKQIFSQK